MPARRRSTPPPAGPPTDALVDALRALARALRLQAAGDAGLPPAQTRVLQELGRGSAGSLGELASRLHTDPSSASVVVQRLVTLGLVARTPSTYDRRRTELSLTDAGRTWQRRHAAAEHRLADAAAALGERRTAAVTRGLQTLADALRTPTNDA
jgi:DNA-binding MarR family transcriptional regulator